jgi:hypothetical protein
MGAKTAILVYADGEPAELLRDARDPEPDATRALVARTNPEWAGSPSSSSGSLGDDLYPSQGTVFAGAFPGIEVLCDQQVMIDRPSELPVSLLQAGSHQRRIILHAMHSVNDWLAFAIWESGTLVRSLSLSPDSGIIENIGAPLDVERPYWAGEHPVSTRSLTGMPDRLPYPLPFHPLELGGKAALRALLGFSVEGRPLDTDIDPFAIRLAGFEVPVVNPITQEEVQEFVRTHTRKRYRLVPGRGLVQIED